MQMKRIISIISVVLFTLLALSGCQESTPDDSLDGRITLWHSWDTGEAKILDEVLAQYQEIHPQVRIITVSVPENQLLEEFYRLGNAGLGPDLLIGKDEWLGHLVESNLIRPYLADKETATFLNARNRKLMEYQDQVYGVPMSLVPYALYYNKDLVADPPKDLDALLIEAEAGFPIAFVPRFEEAYWGIQAFGDGLFDINGRFTLAESGFTEWLTWLDSAQSAPGVILNIDDVSLLNLFASGQIAYYVAGPEKHQQILALMDEETSFEIGVTLLPSGPVGPAGPLLSAEPIYLYAHSSAQQGKIADDLAAFLVNQQQSIQFMRELGRVPANPTVRVDSRIYPIISGFSRQGRTSVVLPNEIQTDPFMEAGNRAYTIVLSGAATPEEAVCQFGLAVADMQQYTIGEIDLPDDCLLASETEDLND